MARQKIEKKGKGLRCPSCGRLTVIPYRKFLKYAAATLTVVSLIFLFLLPFGLPIALGIFIYSYFAPEDKYICSKCKYQTTLEEIAEPIGS